MSVLRVKPLDASCEEAIVHLERQVYEPLGGSVYGHAMTSQVFGAEDEARAYGAFDGDVLVGYLLVVKYSRRVGKHGRGVRYYWYVLDFAVLPCYQRQGVGSQLVGAFAPEAGGLDVEGDTFKPSYFYNTRKGVWDKFGYYVEVLGPSAGEQVRIRRCFGSVPELRSWYLPSWEADRIAALERLVYPAAFCLGEEDFRVDLEEAEAEGANFSRGLIDQNGNLVAYLVAYITESEETGDKVVYGSDLAVHPDYQRQGLGTRVLLEVLQQTAKDGLICEGHCRQGSFQLLQQHPEILALYGYRLAQYQHLPRYNGGEDHWWIRLEPNR